ncbi:hypothetical protein HELRODRAFT_172908 [Helobdella robusta]|uniref:BHLH domain-containing protein n=1 Tax=Helobdella robusta TaxID=6412 RepID=T1F642_HELRO|nr:hypothetical protein HELRODRAFT_172908 [Helobdella robusta]ESO03883.1 hypothetical protein HELRODRAFT_172908 [Helobdella robusta]
MLVNIADFVLKTYHDNQFSDDFNHGIDPAPCKDKHSDHEYETTDKFAALLICTERLDGVGDLPFNDSDSESYSENQPTASTEDPNISSDCGTKTINPLPFISNYQLTPDSFDETPVYFKEEIVVTTAKHDTTHQHLKKLRRYKANVRERRRVMRLAIGFQTLKKHIPFDSTRKHLSQLRILRGAIGYIKFLKRLCGEVAGF